MFHRSILTVFVASALLLVGCATTIHPPAVSGDLDNVVLLKHGKSSSLVLRDAEGNAYRWAYGDWRYYALGQKGVSASLTAVLVPTQAALGRQVIESAPANVAELVAALGIGVDEALGFSVDTDRVAALQDRLSRLFAAASDTLLYNPDPRLEFVVHPRPYTLFRNSNSTVAGWLRELEFEVSGFPILPRWRILSPRAIHTIR